MLILGSMTGFVNMIHHGAGSDIKQRQVLSTILIREIQWSINVTILCCVFEARNDFGRNSFYQNALAAAMKRQDWPLENLNWL